MTFRRSSIVVALYSWIDVLWSLLLTFLVLFSNQQQAETQADTHAGALSFYIEWTPELDLDVDMWIKYPAQSEPLMYSRLQGVNGWIGRDDKGRTDSLQNSENAAIYDLEPGEYVFNLHGFREGGGKSLFPTKVKVMITHRAENGSTDAIFDGFVTLRYAQELTVVRWVMDRKGHISGMNHLPKSLVTETTKQYMKGGRVIQ